jgi:hypothetical protein
MQKLILFILSLFVIPAVRGQAKAHHDLDSIRFVTTDIDNFWSMYHRLKDAKTTHDTIDVVQTAYLDKASPVLHDRMLEQHGITAKTMLRGLRSFPKYIASLEESTRHIKDYTPVLLNDFRRFKALYPDAVFFDHYFVIGDFNSGGRPLAHGIFVGSEIEAADKNSPLDEFDKILALKYAINTVDHIAPLCCHELVHRQQKGTVNSLLAACINEGAADFVGELMSGGLASKYQYEYGAAHEKELWLMFKKDTASNNYNHWLYNGSVKDIPKDMGYYIGYKICEAYYKKASDKKQAIKDILEVTDYVAFLKKSGYGINFDQ